MFMPFLPYRPIGIEMTSHSSGYIFSQKLVFGNVFVNSIWPERVAVYLWWREHGINLFMGLSWLRKTTTPTFTVKISVP